MQGLGFEASKELARKGASVILACRNMGKANIALAKLKEEIPNASLEILQLDLASLKSIHQFADEFKTKYDRLDVLTQQCWHHVWFIQENRGWI